MKSLHPKQSSKFDNRVERAAETLNQGCNVLLWGAAIVAVFMWNAPTPKHNPLHNRPATTERGEEVGSLSDAKYLLAVMTGGSEAKHSAKLTENELRDLDRLASLQTRPEDVAKLKPKARANYQATLAGNPFELAGF